MKKLPLLLIFLCGFVFLSCQKQEDLIPDEEIEEIEETEEVEQEENNELTIQEVEDLNGLLTEVQLDFPDYIERSSKIGAELTRIDYLFGSTYEFYNPEGMGRLVWEKAYLVLLPDIEEALLLADDSTYFKHIGILKIFKAFTFMILVDLYGDIPFLEWASSEPHLDNEEDVYDAVIQLLDEANSNLNLEAPNLENDIYYNHDYSKWIKLANTLKMNIFLNTRLVNPNSISNFQTIQNSGNYINSIGDDFQYIYGSDPLDSNENHPLFDKDYSNTGVATYRSNWLMNEMLQLNDPRIRYYFYRQIDCTPGNVDINGNSCEVDQARLTCSTESPPNHYTTDMVFCSLSSGYWGRDHGNSEGIPPDGFRKTASGVYPAGGNFDDNDFSAIYFNSSSNGKGITPILLSNWVDFMKAEVALSSNNISEASSSIQNGMEKSINKVKSFIYLDSDVNNNFIPSNSEFSKYIASVTSSFDSASNNEKWNILSIQQFISQYGNGIFAYNTYRRTGYPSTLQYHLNPNMGPFIRSLYYPGHIVYNNPNIDQKPNNEVQVFWDNNPSYPSFPYSN